MTESLRLFAPYTQATNQRLAELVAALDPSIYLAPRPTYYQSLHGLRVHLVTTTRTLQGLLRTYSEDKYLVTPLTEASLTPNTSTRDAVTALQAQLDADFVVFANIFDERDLTRPKRLRTLRNGAVHRVSLADVLTQYLVHTAHHRGQLSQLLDELGLDHDIGSVWSFTEPERLGTGPDSSR